MFLHRRSPEVSAAELWNIPQTQIKPDDMPQIRKSSDIAWGVWNRVSGNDKNDIKKIMVFGVVNKVTKDVMTPAR